MKDSGGVRILRRVATGLSAFCCTALFVHALLCSCVRVHLFYHDPGYWVRVRINWEEAGIDLTGSRDSGEASSNLCNLLICVHTGIDNHKQYKR